LSADFLEGGEVHQGDPGLALDWRQYCDISHTSNLRGHRGERLCEEEEQDIQIGEPLRTIVVEPLELPVQQPAGEPEPVPEPEPEQVPVAQ
jgi:hypothetical protein